jgi:hypothetical protein
LLRLAKERQDIVGQIGIQDRPGRPRTIMSVSAVLKVPRSGNGDPGSSPSWRVDHAALG